MSVAPATPAATLRSETTGRQRSLVGRRVAAVFPFVVIASWAVSRLVANAVIVLGTERAVPDQRWYTGFLAWDYGWYLSISRYGYGLVPPSYEIESGWPFFPLVPGIMKVGHAVGLSEAVTVVVLNHLVLLVALAGVWRIANRHLSRRGAAIAVIATAIFPASVVMTLAYPSAIFLASTVWAYCLIEERRGPWGDATAGLLLAVAAIVRPNGIIAAAACCVVLLGPGRPFRRALLVMAPAAVAFVTWLTFLWRWTDDPFIFWKTKGAWDEVTILEFFRDGMEDAARPHMLMALPALAVIAFCWRRLPAHWLTFAAAYLLPSLLVGVVGLGRYVNDCFVSFIAAAMVLEKLPAWLRAAAYTVSLAGLALFSYIITYYKYVP